MCCHKNVVKSLSYPVYFHALLSPIFFPSKISFYQPCRKRNSFELWCWFCSIALMWWTIILSLPGDLYWYALFIICVIFLLSWEKLVHAKQFCVCVYMLYDFGTGSRTFKIDNSVPLCMIECFLPLQCVKIVPAGTPGPGCDPFVYFAFTLCKENSEQKLFNCKIGKLSGFLGVTVCCPLVSDNKEVHSL